ncbi:MAG: hypothetical protein LBM69_03690 [Lachnospiraceae bacterium]|nr:hypothetical protein [Lachnospiraceae bacterium]
MNSNQILSVIFFSISATAPTITVIILWQKLKKRGRIVLAAFVIMCVKFLLISAFIIATIIT